MIDVNKKIKGLFDVSVSKDVNQVFKEEGQVLNSSLMHIYHII